MTTRNIPSELFDQSTESSPSTAMRLVSPSPPSVAKLVSGGRLEQGRRRARWGKTPATGKRLLRSETWSPRRCRVSDRNTQSNSSRKHGGQARTLSRYLVRPGLFHVEQSKKSAPSAPLRAMRDARMEPSPRERPSRTRPSKVFHVEQSSWGELCSVETLGSNSDFVVAQSSSGPPREGKPWAVAREAAPLLKGPNCPQGTAPRHFYSSLDLVPT